LSFFFRPSSFFTSFLTLLVPHLCTFFSPCLYSLVFPFSILPFILPLSALLSFLSSFP
jgi:hypothetical protein